MSRYSFSVLPERLILFGLYTPIPRYHGNRLLRMLLYVLLLKSIFSGFVVGEKFLPDRLENTEDNRAIAAVVLEHKLHNRPQELQQYHFSPP